MSQRDTALPLTFRRELLEKIMPALRAGECCSLVGTSGAGKSNLVRFLQRPDVQDHYWGAARVWMVDIDSNGLVFGAQPDEYVVAELMIHRLIRAAERHQVAPDLLDDFNQKYTHLMSQPSAHLALRYLERMCGRLIEGLGAQIVFAVDQFEDLWEQLGPRLFLNLRHLRDEFKYRLCYLVLTRERLGLARQRARDDLQAVEAFCELFSHHTYGLGMYGAADATTMLERIAARRELTISAELRHILLAVSGGHAGLLRAAYWALCTAHELPADPGELLAVATVVEECARLWDDMRPEEQRVARAVTLGSPLAQSDGLLLGELRFKQLVAGAAPALFSPLFAAYVRGLAAEDVGGVVVAPRLHKVWVDGVLLPKALAPLEFGLLEHLALNAGQVCRREDILQRLYGEGGYDANDERLDTLLRRLRETLGDDAKSPRHLITHRGIGIRLAKGRVQQ